MRIFAKYHIVEEDGEVLLCVVDIFSFRRKDAYLWLQMKAWTTGNQVRNEFLCLHLRS
jgi:hypothetical protein